LSPQSNFTMLFFERRAAGCPFFDPRHFDSDFPCLLILGIFADCYVDGGRSSEIVAPD